MKFNAFYGHAAKTGDFFLRKIVQTAHVEDTTGLRRQAVESPFDDLLNLLREKLLGIAGLEGGDAHLLIPSGVRAQPVGNVGGKFLPSNVIQAFVFDDRKDISRKIRPGTNILPVFPIIDERIGYQVLGRTSIPDIRCGETYKPFLVFGEQVVEQTYVRRSLAHKKRG